MAIFSRASAPVGVRWNEVHVLRIALGDVIVWDGTTPVIISIAPAHGHAVMPAPTLMVGIGMSMPGSATARARVPGPQVAVGVALSISALHARATAPAVSVGTGAAIAIASAHARAVCVTPSLSVGATISTPPALGHGEVPVPDIDLDYDDAFNRPDGSMGSDWITSTHPPVIENGRVHGGNTGPNSADTRHPALRLTPLDADGMQTWLTLRTPTGPANGDLVAGVVLRGHATTFDRVEAVATPSSAAIVSVIGGTRTLRQFTPLTAADGDQLRFAVFGTLFAAYLADSPTPVMTWNDSSNEAGVGEDYRHAGFVVVTSKNETGARTYGFDIDDWHAEPWDGTTPVRITITPATGHATAPAPTVAVGIALALAAAATGRGSVPIPSIGTGARVVGGPATAHAVMPGPALGAGTTVSLSATSHGRALVPVPGVGAGVTISLAASAHAHAGIPALPSIPYPSPALYPSTSLYPKGT